MDRKEFGKNLLAGMVLLPMLPEIVNAATTVAKPALLLEKQPLIFTDEYLDDVVYQFTNSPFRYMQCQWMMLHFPQLFTKENTMVMICAEINGKFYNSKTRIMPRGLTAADALKQSGFTHFFSMATEPTDSKVYFVRGCKVD